MRKPYDVREIIARLPKGKPLFPDDYLTDQPERFRAAELVREKILRLTEQEVPHSVAVVIESWEDTPKLLRIGAPPIPIASARSLERQILPDEMRIVEQVLDMI